MKVKLFNRLSVKLIIILSVLLLILLSVYTFITIKNTEEFLTDCRINSAHNISDVIKKSTRYSMLLNRREDVHQIINTIATEPGVKGIRIYNKEGVIIYSADSLEINKRVDLNAEACYGCHNQETPLSKLSTENRERIFSIYNDERFLGVINPINNEQDCFTAGCHAHPPDKEILGVIDVILSLEELDNRITKMTSRTLVNSFLLGIIIVSASGLFIIILVNKPLKKLGDGIGQISRGNLNYKIEIESKDELGEIAVNFNEMSDKLNSAYNEIKDWSENLNQKVKEKTEELKNIYNQVVQIEKLASLGKLSATVAHELNNPLAGILNYSKLVSKKLKEHQHNGDNTKLIYFLDLISEESARCGKIVKDLLLFSHKEENEFIDADLVNIVNKSLELINHHLVLNKVTLNKNIAEDKILIYCNPDKIKQAFVSIFINALEAMKEEGILTVNITCSGRNVLIRINDTGTGISMRDLPNIFEPFFSTKNNINGTGLGLSVVYGIITNHNGKIEVEKTSDTGTTFLITLPLKEGKNG